MNIVALRDFQLKPSKYLDDLPITLTRYNLPFAVITAYQPDKPIAKEEPPLPEEFPVRPKPESKPTARFCQVGNFHPKAFCSGMPTRFYQTPEHFVGNEKT